MSKGENAFAALVVVAVLGALGFLLYSLGLSHQQVKDVRQDQKAEQQAHQAVKAKARADLGRAAATGKAHEQDRTVLDTLYQRLDREAADAPTAADDHYVLPDERLQLWRAANAGGADHGAATGQSDGRAEAAPAAALGAHPGSGSEPQGRGEGLPPVGLSGLPAAAVPAGR